MIVDYIYHSFENNDALSKDLLKYETLEVLLMVEVANVVDDRIIHIFFLDHYFLFDHYYVLLLLFEMTILTRWTLLSYMLLSYMFSVVLFVSFFFATALFVVTSSITNIIHHCIIMYALCFQSLELFEQSTSKDLLPKLK